MIISDAGRAGTFSSFIESNHISDLQDIMHLFEVLTQQPVTVIVLGRLIGG